jgi:tetratricopeptide (TPR) repeat protein
VPPAKPAGSVAVPNLGRNSGTLAKIQVRDAGNANAGVVPGEWTPGTLNPHGIARGLATLKQYDDALAAAKKAQECRPRTRGCGATCVAHADAGDPVDALRLRPGGRPWQDADAFRQIGILNAQLSQIQEAGRAFDKALAIHPGDHVVLCMRAAVAALSSAPKDTYATAKQVKAIDAKCRGG